MPEPMRKLLIANRGEIACRIIRSARALGIETVAVHSQADRGALHVEMADRAVEIGPPPAAQSYLDAARLLQVAAETGADAVHPGYGFLSESADFAKAVIDGGLTWVGPAPETIALMGDKQTARRSAAAAGVPVVPGSAGFAPGELNGLEAAAREVGFPLLAKAAAGGGGIGMRLADGPEGLADLVAAVQDAAVKSFGSGEVYLERYLPRARHVEVQVFGLGDGRAFHLNERDCSLQRRFQKVIEEAAAPNLPDAVRARMCEAALALCRATRYAGAGTVEFIVDADTHEFFFLEMNTRIQVEHPVSEMTTGADLVALAAAPCCGRAARAHGRRHAGHRPCHRMPALRRKPGQAVLPLAGPAGAVRPAHGGARSAHRHRLSRRRYRHALLRPAAGQDHRPGRYPGGGDHDRAGGAGGGLHRGHRQQPRFPDRLPSPCRFRRRRGAHAFHRRTPRRADRC
jgi:3-methylcrotonyl-CoA carboxylase alpha subunit